MLRTILLFLIATTAVASAKTTDNLTSHGPPVQYKIEVPVCRSSAHLIELLAASSRVPADDDLARLNKKYKAKRCTYIDSTELRVIRDHGPLTIGKDTGVLIEVEHQVKTKKTIWFAFSAPPGDEEE